LCEPKRRSPPVNHRIPTFVVALIDAGINKKLSTTDGGFRGTFENPFSPDIFSPVIAEPQNNSV